MRKPHAPLRFAGELGRFIQPILDCCARLNLNRQKRFALARYVLCHMAILEKPYWQWTAQEWVSLIHKTVPAERRAALRGQVVVLAFHLGGYNVATQVMPNLLKSTQLVSLLWGSAVVEHSISLVRGYLLAIGYRVKETLPAGRTLGQTIVAAMLALNEPDVRRWDEAAYRALTRGDQLLGTVAPGGKRRHYALSVALALHRLGIFTVDPQVHAHGGCFEKSVAGYTAEWGQWADRFAALSVAGKAGAKQLRYFVQLVGRWALAHHEEASRSPADWDVEIAADFAAFVSNGKIGELEQKPSGRDAARFGTPLSPNTKASRMSMIRVFFDTLIAGGLIRRRFATRAVFRLPAHIAREAAPKPRDLHDDVWAKLLWAGLNLEQTDLGPVLRNRYPIEMLQAIVVVWLFAGLRSNELRRLEKDCIRWEFSLLETNAEGAQPSICYLMVPTNKYKPEFRKPVAGEVGKALEAWLAVRPTQPAILDPKTLHLEDKLFCVRGRLIGERIARAHSGGAQARDRTSCECRSLSRRGWRNRPSRWRSRVLLALDRFDNSSAT
jgi:integrase